jgi:hypothetical protein
VGLFGHEVQRDDERLPLTTEQRKADRKIARSYNEMIFALAANRIARYPLGYAGREGELNAIVFCRRQYPRKEEAALMCSVFGC